jgi:calcineurin-like phosphoesterase family protein
MIEQLYKCFQHWSEKGSVWVYSDPHFNDEEAAGYGRISDEEQLKLINSKVGKNDTIIILGDVGDLSYARRIKGRKILICGNHDLGASNYQRQITYVKFDFNKYSKEEVVKLVKETYPDAAIEVDEGYDLTHSPFHFWSAKVDNKLFDEVYTGPLFIGEKLLLSHEPINFSFALNLHGHCHNGQQNSNHINCCSNVINYTPVSLNQICKSGVLKRIETLHRTTIDDATERKQKRLKKINSRK